MDEHRIGFNYFVEIVSHSILVRGATFFINLEQLLQQNCVEIDKEFYLIGKIGVNDNVAKVKDKSNEVFEQTEKELINFVTSQQTQSPYVTISSTLS